MINYGSFYYWLEIVEEIKLEEQILKINVETYFMNYELKYLDYIEQNIKELKRLYPVRQQYFISAFMMCHMTSHLQ